MRKSGQYTFFSLSYYILSTAGGFEKIAGKGGGVEYLILKCLLTQGTCLMERSIDRGYN